MLYNIREDLSDGVVDGSQLSGSENILSPPSSQLIPPLTSVFFEDDSAAREQPSQHVDYLSHEWTEEDVWTSYKFVRSKRNMYPNSVRLENASWRTWEQKRRNLKTVSPETVKWLKDHDVTWLYGPLQPGSRTLSTSGTVHRDLGFGFLDKKPCLKKRTLSEIMLLRSISSTALIRQAIATQKNRSYSNFIFRSNPPKLKRSNTTPESLEASSDGGSPPLHQSPWLSKNVRFHENVEQRITIAHPGEDEPEYYYISGDDQLLRPAAKTITRLKLSSSRLRKHTPPSKTIEILPHVPLKSPSPQQRNDIELPIMTRLATSFSNDFEEVKVDDWKLRATPLQDSRDNVQIFQDELEAMKMASEDTMDLPCNSLFMATLDQRTECISHVSTAVEGNNSNVSFQNEACQSQLASFSFQNFTRTATREYSDMAEKESCWSADIDFSTTDESDVCPLDTEFGCDSTDDIDSVPMLSSAKIELVGRVMAEFWVVFNVRAAVSLPSLASVLPRRGHWTLPTFSSPAYATEVSAPNARALADHEQSLRQTLPLFVRKTVESLVREQQNSDEASIIARLSAIIQDCQDKVLEAFKSEDYNSSNSEDTGSSTEDSPVTSSDSGYGSEKERVREMFCTESEKGVKEWELHSNSWDDDEALAWESSF